MNLYLCILSPPPVLNLSLLSMCPAIQSQPSHIADFNVRTRAYASLHAVTIFSIYFSFPTRLPCDSEKAPVCLVLLALNKMSTFVR
mmetsp:Transcript_18255/g.29998  ORF Transcript_18255/g.29998 Transcript_18255/m.29998 type:complete len:86 (+) Transcript_18255:1009-1266(+)